MSVQRSLRAFLSVGLCLAVGCGDGVSGDGGAGGAGATGGDGGGGGGGGGDLLTLEVTATAGLFRAVQGETIAAPVSVSRGSGITGPVRITVENGPVGVAFVPLTIASGADSGEIEISTVVTAPQGGPSTVTLVAVLTPEGADPVEHTTEVPLWVAGASQTLDRSFGSAGILRIADVSFVRDAAVDSEGRIVILASVGGSPTIQRLAQDGRSDPTFGTDGRVSDIAPLPDSLAVLEPDDRIVVGTRSEVFDDPSFVRAFRASDGQVDTDFGDAGDRTVSGLSAPRLAARPGGLFVLASEEIIALTTDGEPDPSFAAPSLANSYFRVLADGSGRAILLGGYRVAATGEKGAELLRLLSSGAADPSFGTGGVALVPGATGEDFSVSSQIGLAPSGDGLLALTIVDTSISPVFRYSGYVRFYDNGAIDTRRGISGVDYLSFGVGVAEDGRAFVSGGFDVGDPRSTLRVLPPDGDTFATADDIDFFTQKILVERKLQRLIVIGNLSSQTVIRRYWL